jgi:polysaccharide biosynthesis protein PslH
MKVLFTTPVLEHPAAGGPQLRIENTIKALSSVTELSIIYQANHPCTIVDETNNFFKQFADQYLTIYKYPRNKYLRFILRVIHRIFSIDYDYQSKTIIDFVKLNNIDCIWFGYGNISYSLIKTIKKTLPGIKVVCDTDSVWSRFILRELPFAKGRRKRMIEKSGALKQKEESLWVNLCEVTTAVSEFDAEYYRSIADDTSRIHVFSNVIDLDEYSSIPDKPDDFKNPSIFLAGSYGANSAMNMAANWILDEVLPIVRRSCPNIHFYIVGKRSDIEFGHRKSDSVTVTGMVDTVLPYLCHTNVALVPLMFESGTRFKILEAGACKTPIISTTLGAEGIPVIHDKEVLIADKAINFAKEIVNVLNDSELSNKLTKNCYDLISRKYSLTVLEREAKKILEYLKNV